MAPELSSARARGGGESRPRDGRDGAGNITAWSVLRRRWWLLAAGLLAGGTAGLIAATRPPLYEASTTVFLTPVFEPSGLSTGAGLHVILTNHSSAAAVLEQLGLRKSPTPLDAQTFLRDALTIEQIPNGYFFRVKVRLTDPELAASAANALSERAVELMTGIWSDVLAARPARIEKELEVARVALSAAEQRLTRYESGSAAPASAGTGVPGEDLARLQADVEVKRIAYIETGARLDRARSELATTTPPLRLVDRAMAPERPISLSRPLRLALGALAGLIAAGCITVALETRRLLYGSAANGVAG